MYPVCDNCEVPKWNSVKYRMPEDDVYVLIYYNKCILEAYHNPHRSWQTRLQMRNPDPAWFVEVTHWMPLPKPPQKDSNE